MIMKVFNRCVITCFSGDDIVFRRRGCSIVSLQYSNGFLDIGFYALSSRIDIVSVCCDFFILNVLGDNNEK